MLSLVYFRTLFDEYCLYLTNKIGFPFVEVTVDGKSKNSIPLTKKGGVAREARKALNDITNKSSIHEGISQSKKSEKKHSKVVENGYSNQKVSESEAQSKKKISVEEKLNIAEEGFLHDHSKCIDAQKETTSEVYFWDTVLPGHGNLFKIIIFSHTSDSPYLLACLEVEAADLILLLVCCFQVPTNLQFCIIESLFIYY